MNRRILAPEIQNFIKDHENHDPFALALKYQEIAGVSAREVALQIQSKQKANRKLPEWSAAEGLVYPSPLAMEQCSSETTARYKANLVRGQSLIDLTGGAGVDAYYFSKKIARVVYVERDPQLVETANHNFKTLQARNIETICATAEEYLAKSGPFDWIYLDPSRRTERKVFRMQDSEPNVSSLLPSIFQKTSNALLKLSPLMDIDLAIKELAGVCQTHVVSVNGECKETLYVLKRDFEEEPEIFAVNLKPGTEEILRFKRSDEKNAPLVLGEAAAYLYEPNASILKSGAFKLVSSAYDVEKLHQHSHLYTSNLLIPNFPGRKFKVEAVLPYDKNAIKRRFQRQKSHVVSRNFPLSVSQIRSAMGIKEGGESYLFFTASMHNRKIVIVGNPV